MGTKRWESNDALLQALKEEIIRLGIQDNPSMTKYQEMYARGVAPSPNSVIGRTGKSWGVLMKELDFDYDGKKNIVKAGKKNTLDKNGNSYRSQRLSNPEVLKNKLNEAIELIKNEHITSAKDFQRVSTEKIGVSYKTFQRHGFPFTKIVEMYEDKYGKKVSVGSKYANKSNAELLNMVIEYMRENNINSFSKYGEKRTKDLPSSSVITKRLNKTFKEVNELIKVLL